MTRPTADHVAATIDALETLLRRTNGGMRARIVAQLARDRRGGNAMPDGYPRTTLGARGGSGGEDTATATEAAVFARLEHPADEHHRLTWAAWHRLEAMLADAQLIHGWLARLEAAGKPAADDTDAWCENHLRHGVTEPRDAANRRRTCAWCYGVQRAYGALPTGALIDRRARGERFSEQAIAAALGVQRKAG